MSFLYFLDDIGIYLIRQPMLTLRCFADMQFINMFDDLGIVLVIRPLGYMHRFANFILQAD